MVLWTMKENSIKSRKQEQQRLRSFYHYGGGLLGCDVVPLCWFCKNMAMFDIVCTVLWAWITSITKYVVLYGQSIVRMIKLLF